MNNGRIKKPATIIRFVFAILSLTAGIACSYEPLTITGKVVDESGAALSDVEVWACYSGWGWSEDQLVWDKNYCSETTQTENDGLYVIAFKGPVSSRLRAEKDGWVQTQDFNTTHSRIILTKVEDNSSRLRTEKEQRDQKVRQRLPEELETDYYCRVILPETRTINLSYHDEVLSITPTLLEHKVQSGALFAVRGSSRAVNAFSDEAVLKINGEVPGSNVSLKSVETSCGMDIHFIGINTPGFNASADARTEILVPSIRAMFDMQIWGHSTQQ